MDVDIPDSENVEFMLQRSLAIGLSDPSESIASGKSVAFSPNERGGLLFAPALLTLNAVRMLRSFEKCVVSFGNAFVSQLEEAKSNVGNVDFEKTAANRLKGIEKIELLTPEVHWSNEDQLLFSLVATEYREHCKILVEVLGQNVELVNKSVINCMRPIKQFLSNSQVCYEEFRSCQGSFLDKALAMLTPSLQVYRKLLFSSGVLTTKLEEYQAITEGIYSPLENGIRYGQKIAKWRRKYAEFAIGLSPNGALQFSQTRTPQDLFGLWCFAELTSSLRLSALGDVFQCAQLRPADQGPTFELRENTFAYFDFFGEPIHHFGASQVFSKTRLRWLIRNFDDDQKNIAIDAHYGPWCLDTNFKIMATMNEQCISRGIVFSSEPIPDGVFPRELTDRYFQCLNFGRNQESVFCAISLEPRSQSQKRNADVLEKLLKNVVFA